MKILMLKTIKGSPDGISVEEYKEGNTYDVQSESLVKVFVANRYATVCQESFDELKVEATKAEKPTYKNKAMASPEDKEAKTKEG